MATGKITGKGLDQGALDTYLTNVKTLVNNLRTAAKTTNLTGVVSKPALAAGASSGKNYKVALATTAIFSGVGTTAPTGSSGAYTNTSKSNMNVTKTKFGAAQFEMKASGAIVTAYAGPASSAQSYATAVAAKAGLPSVTASQVIIGTMTFKAVTSPVAVFGTAALGKASSATSGTYASSASSGNVTHVRNAVSAVVASSALALTSLSKS